jgi:DNA-binding response OmpR family regulator
MQENLPFPAAESVGTQPQSQMSSPRRILVVDQDPYLRHLSADLLMQQGYEVNAAEDGTVGREELQTNDYSLLITSHTPPMLNGVKLVRKAREIQPALPVVMVARKLPVRERVQHPSLHIVAMLFRPTALDSVLRTVRIVLGCTGSVPAQVAPPCPPPTTAAGKPEPVEAPFRALKRLIWEIHQRSGGHICSGLNE